MSRKLGAIQTPVINRTATALVIALNDARVFTDELAFSYDDQAVRVNLQA